MPYLHLYAEKINPVTKVRETVPEIYEVKEAERDGGTIEALRPDGNTWILHASQYKRIVISSSAKPETVA